jgi:molybdopterin-guanine dinucleotide biosynthesis protein A
LFYRERVDLKRYNNQTIVGMILAGGKSRRMNFNDKSLQKINKYSLIDRVIVRAKKQVDYLLINSNSDHIKNNYNEYIVIKDTIKGNLGPLAGVLTGLEWIKKKDSEINWLITFPVDSPFFPSDLVDIFLSHVNEEQIIVAESNSRIHPVFAMWNKDLIPYLKETLNNRNLKIDEFTKNFKMKVVKFPFIDYDPFFNINNQDDLIKAKKIEQLITAKGD